MRHNPRYPLKHLSIRVPWHDAAWDGSICRSAKANSACLILKSCALGRDDTREQDLAGTLIKDLDESAYPPCVGERATFMAPFAFTKTLNHPYVQGSPTTHGHLRPTLVTFPAFSAAAVPYHWMLKENAEEKAEWYDLAYDEAREPILDWRRDNTDGGKDTWVQESSNQRALLNCFFEHLEADTSLVFFYAKQVPFTEAAGRVLVGAGRISRIIPSEDYHGSNKRFSASYWEHMILHTIREKQENGFLLPYHAALEYATTHPEFDPASLAVVVPGDATFEFSFAAEHVSNDSAIRVLLDCLRSLEEAERLGIGKHHAKAIGWIHDEIARLEKLRGFYPGMGGALRAFGIERGHFVAAEIINGLANEHDNPWALFEQALDEPAGILSPTIATLIPESARKLYKAQKADAGSPRLPLLHLISRFELSMEQATVLFVEEEREGYGIYRKDQEYLANPYLIYEDLRLTLVPVAFSTIDLGLFLKGELDSLVPAGLLYTDPLHHHRVRALAVQQLEAGALAGHTLLPRKELVRQIRELKLQPNCLINSDYFVAAEPHFATVIELEEMKDGARAYQLTRFAKARRIISQKINDRIKGRPLVVQADWEAALDSALAPHTKGEPDEVERRARAEKAAALKAIAESRFSVLIGPAGTGKTTLLTILAAHPDVEHNGVLLLAPTGKARVRMQEIARDVDVTAKTLAQFLSGYNRYIGDVQRYVLSDKYCEEQYDTVILDEASMLTEEMLASTLDCLKGVKRFILVGDHRQLPPIGAGRPFVDTIRHLKPDGVEACFPRVGKGFAELTIKRRQGGAKREDMLLAEWFSGEPLEPGADAIINHIITHPNGNYLRLEQWNSSEEFEAVLERAMADELGYDGQLSVEAFNRSLGSVDGRYFNFRQAALKAEDWQILTPVRDRQYGVRAINRRIHKVYRADKVKYARDRFGKIPKPIGLEEIVYGDKVINLMNARRRDTTVFPKEGCLKYIANGEIGIVVGQFKMPGHKYNGKPWKAEIEFTSQQNFKYDFSAKEFGDDAGNPLELAYALTVHKAQGSEFGKVFLVVPNPCFLLSRELLYTALTRQKEKVIVLYQGSVFDIKAWGAPLNSDTLRRITNLFVKPDLLEIEGQYLEKNLIHQASDGKMLRSKSELMIYQRLLDKDLQPIYEKKLMIKDVEKLPDFTIENEDTGEVYYWEHCGMMYDEEYRKRWQEKYDWYHANGITESGGENGFLIVTEDKPHRIEDGSLRGAISIRDIDEVIGHVFNR